MRPVVIGAGIGGLVAAWQLTQAGHTPLVLEARGYAGGLIAGAPLPAPAAGAAATEPAADAAATEPAPVPTPLVTDIGAESFAVRGGGVEALTRELGLAVAPPEGRSWIMGADGVARQIPNGILGIPGQVGDEPDADMAAALTPAELERALVDLTLGPDVGADCTDLASFVTARLGVAVLEKLVTPVAGGIHSAPPRELAVDTVAPGLRAATRRHGSLLRAVAQMRGLPHPQSPIKQVVGGMHRLTAALAAGIEAAGGQIRYRTGATALERSADGWLIHTTEMGKPHGGELAFTGPAGTVSASGVVVACSGPTALPLLTHVTGVPAWDMPVGSPIAHMTLLVHAPVLDDAPRGSGMLTAPGAPIAAKALTHMNKKWPWLDAELVRRYGPSHHLLRVSYGRKGEAYPQPTPASAVADVAQLCGLDETAGRDEDADSGSAAGENAGLRVISHRLIRWDGTLAPPTPAHRANVAKLRDTLDAIDGLAVTGAWFAGSGIAAIIPHARAAADKVARAAAEKVMP